MTIKHKVLGDHGIEVLFGKFRVVEDDGKNTRGEYNDLNMALQHVAHLRLLDEGPKQIEPQDYNSLLEKIFSEIAAEFMTKKEQDKTVEQAVGMTKVGG